MPRIIYSPDGLVNRSDRGLWLSPPFDLEWAIPLVPTVVCSCPEYQAYSLRNLSEAIATYIDAQFDSLIVGENLFAFSLPDTPYIACAVIPVGGPFDPSNPIAKKMYEIRFRTPFSEDGTTMIHSLSSVFEQQWNILCGYPGRFYLNREPGAYQKDPNRMYIFNLSYTFEHRKWR